MARLAAGRGGSGCAPEAQPAPVAAVAVEPAGEVEDSAVVDAEG